MSPWKRNLWITWVCQFIAIGGMSMVVPFLPFYIRELGITQPRELTQWSGLVYSAPFFVLPVAMPLWAMVGDRYGRKLMVVRAIFGLALSQIFIGFAATPYQLFAGRLLQGAFGGFIGASQALISTRTPREHLGYALAALQTSTAAGAMAGPVFGGLIADSLNYRITFLLVGALCMISGAVVLWKVEEHPAHLREGEPKIRFLDRYRYLWRSHELRWCLLMALVSTAATCAVLPVFALFVEQLSKSEIFLSTKAGVIVGMGALAILLTSRWWGKRSDRHLYRSNVRIGAAVAAVALAAQAFVMRAWQLAPLHAIESGFFCGISVTLFSLISRRTDERIRGGVLSVLSSFQTLGALFGQLAGSWLASHYKIPSAFVLAAVLMSLVGLMGSRLEDKKAELSKHATQIRF